MEAINQLGVGGGPFGLGGGHHAQASGTSAAGSSASAVGVGAPSGGGGGGGASGLARKSSDLGPHPAGPSLASQPGDLSTAILDTFKSALREAEGYATYYESRIKVEEDYIKSFKAVVEKQRDLDSKIDGKGWEAGVSPTRTGGTNVTRTLRGAWYELRENDLREIETRSHMIDTMRQAVVAPLTSFKDAQERIRKRVKEDLKTHLSSYDEMKNVTLPRIKKQYDKKCEEVEQLRQQQQAIDDQKALLSASNAGSHGYEGSSSGGSYHSPDNSDFGPPPPVPPRSGNEGMTSPSLSSPVPIHDRLSTSSGNEPHSSGFSNASSSFSPPSAGGSMPHSASSATGKEGKDKEEKKGNFLDVLRNKEGWENARKEAPKKINAFISRMRDEGGRGLGLVGGGGGERDVQSHMSSSHESSGGVGGGLFGGHREPSTRANASQNIALKSVKAKRESDELDRAYRKAIFDLETLRIRREKTMLAAVESCKECKRELAHTAQTCWLQAERAGLLLSSSNVSLKTHAEEVALKSTEALETEIQRFEGVIPHIEEIFEPPVTYVNFWHGECQDLLFGASLTDYAFSHQRSSAQGPQPPLIVTKCIEFIESRALKQPGIYRISAKHSALQGLAHAVEKNEATFQFDPERDEPTAVAGLLKMYLRQLPEPVLPIPWEERIKYTHEREEHIKKGFPNLKGRIRRAPPINQVTLKAIVEHLARIAAHAEENKMTASNLAVVFGPVLLSEADHETTSLAAAMEEDKTMEDLITFNSVIFGSAVAPQSTATDAPFGPTAVVAPDAPVGAPGTTALKRSSAVLKGAPTGTPEQEAPPAPPVKSSADEYAPQPVAPNGTHAPTLATSSLSPQLPPHPPISPLDASSGPSSLSTPHAATPSSQASTVQNQSLSAQTSLGHGQESSGASAASGEWPGSAGNLYLAASSALNSQNDNVGSTANPVGAQPPAPAAKDNIPPGFF